MADKLQVLDLFSGIGGFSLGLERTGGFETAAFCEIEEFPRKVLAKHWPDVPCFEDVRTLTKEKFNVSIDVICGGYPCQPFSTAGKRQGTEDDRHLWPEVNRLLDEYRPAWFIGENVAGHVTLGLDNVLSDLEAKGYTARTFIIPACAIDAKHRRDRTWIMAHSQSERCREKGEFGSGRKKWSAGSSSASSTMANTRHPRFLQRGGDANACQESEFQSGIRRNGLSGREQGSILADSSGKRQSGQGQSFKQLYSVKNKSRQASDAFAMREPRFWPTEPAVGRVANGVPGRVDRLKSLGNAVVPQIPEILGYAILEAEGINVA